MTRMLDLYTLALDLETLLYRLCVQASRGARSAHQELWRGLVREERLHQQRLMWCRQVAQTRGELEEKRQVIPQEVPRQWQHLLQQLEAFLKHPHLEPEACLELLWEGDQKGVHPWMDALFASVGMRPPGPSFLAPYRRLLERLSRKTAKPLSREHTPPERRLGWVDSLEPAWGFGWIRGEDGERYFFLFDPEQSLHPRQRVSFTLRPLPWGPRAEGVERVSEP